MTACNRERAAGAGTHAVMEDEQAGDFSCR